ncbi:ABC transporter permease subunit [Litoreibacter roseus]|uniref:Thiamine/thiamine pyrophosphate ABC transporter permease ThiP n=1 Tax=Litoreibacter roseus TaxID=2601869 RepID=A0A6N6JDD1_9RHOB|nr:ABC transporter permease subunit [Litoreibacter roseus]GFE64351.1 thiamine/thiamine pyrophosphate ABC transporter permease ThiP [Litoreibacter roseus]
MAARIQQVNPFALMGWLVGAGLLFLTLGTIGAVAWRAEDISALGARDWAAVRFTLLQAVLSAVLSVVFAIPVARALARRRFRGRRVLITLLGAPFILPVIVAVLGLLAVFGRAGILNTALGWLGLGPVSIYGMQGVLLAHVFFNLPLAVRLILQALQEVPAERWRLAASLGMGSGQIFRHIELRVLLNVVPGALMVIFLICTTSFAVALALGGGPGATTIELAIYQAFRFDFDLSKAALLGLIQFAICAGAGLFALWISAPSGLGGGLDRDVPRWDGMAGLDALWIIAAALFLLVPLGLIVGLGLPKVTTMGANVWFAAGRSLWVAVGSAVLTLVLALPLVIAAQRSARYGPALESAGYLSIAASPLVIGTGLFILVYRWADPVALALPITMLVNAAMSLPFAVRALSPALGQVETTYGRLADTLGMTGWARIRLLILPRLRRPIGFAMGLAAALSMGDLGVIALFSDPETTTLPLEMYRLMAAYRMDDAYAAALLLLTMSLALFWAFDQGGRVGD